MSERQTLPVFFLKTQNAQLIPLFFILLHRSTNAFPRAGLLVLATSDPAVLRVHVSLVSDASFPDFCCFAGLKKEESADEKTTLPTNLRRKPGARRLVPGAQRCAFRGGVFLE